MGAPDRLECAAMADFSGLSIRGRIATPSDSDWDEARQAWNLAADQRPEAVALVESADDVSKVIGFARENGLKVTGQGTGHGAVALGSLEDTILIKTERMRDVAIEGEKAQGRGGRARRGRRRGGDPEGHVLHAGHLARTSGITGYTLGGGLSWLGRKYGWACNRVSAIELVTADGEPRTVDARIAIPTSSGRCAAVAAATRSSRRSTSSCCRSPRPTPVGLLFPPELTADGLRAYRDWCAQAPEEVASMVRMLNLPPIPDIPEAIRGKKWFAITVASIGTEEEGGSASRRCARSASR